MDGRADGQWSGRRLRSGPADGQTSRPGWIGERVDGGGHWVDRRMSERGQAC